MHISETFIRRPIATSLVMAAIALLRCFGLAVIAPSNLLDCYIKSAIRSARAAMVFEGFNPIASGMIEPSAT